MPRHMDAPVTEHALLYAWPPLAPPQGKGRRGDTQLLPLSPGHHHRPQISTPTCGARHLQRSIQPSKYTSLVHFAKYSNAWHIIAHRFAVPQMDTTARRCSRPGRCPQIGAYVVGCSLVYKHSIHCLASHIFLFTVVDHIHSLHTLFYSNTKRHQTPPTATPTFLSCIGA
jgi:hypothetical protein